MNYEFPNRIIINKTMEDEKLEDKSKEEYVTKYTSSDNEVAKFNSEIQTNYSSLEEIKKIHSESLSVISDSSEGGNLSEGQDCNKSSDHICKLRERKRTYNMVNLFDVIIGEKYLRC